MRVLKIQAQTIRTESGLWCDTCALPSAVRVDLVLWTSGRMSLVSVCRCRECGVRPDTP